MKFLCCRFFILVILKQMGTLVVPTVLPICQSEAIFLKYVLLAIFSTSTECRLQNCLTPPLNNLYLESFFYAIGSGDTYLQAQLTSSKSASLPSYYPEAEMTFCRAY